MIISTKNLIFSILILFVLLIGISTVSAENMDSDIVAISEDISDEITTVYDDTSYQNQEVSDEEVGIRGYEINNLNSDDSNSFADLTQSVNEASTNDLSNLEISSYNDGLSYANEEVETLLDRELVSREFENYNWYVKNGVLYGKTTYYDEYEETYSYAQYDEYGDIIYSDIYYLTSGENSYKIEKYGTIKPKIKKTKFKYGEGVSIFSGIKHFRFLKAKVKYQYDKKHYKTITLETGWSGWWEFPTTKFKTLGKHKIIVYAYGKKLTKTIYLKRGKYKIDASSATVKKGKNKYIEIEVMDKYLNSIKNKKIKVKVAGKTYKLKTDKWGIAKFNTKSLSLGKHKVKISVAGNKFYKSASKKITINVKKYIPHTTVYKHYNDGYYLSGYHERYNYDNDMEYQAWLGSEWGGYGQVSVEVSGRNNVKIDSVRLVFKSNGKTYTKKLTVYDNYCVYVYIPRSATYVKTTIKWHYK